MYPLYKSIGIHHSLITIKTLASYQHARAYSLLFLLGFVVLFATPSLARRLEEDDVPFLDSDINEDDEGVEDEEMLWGIDSLKHHHHHHHAPSPRGGRHQHHCHSGHHAPSPHSHRSPRNHHQALPPPHHHAPPPESF